MRMTRSRLLFVILVPGLLLAWYIGDIVGLEGWITWLANQPGVTTAFQHPESGRSDALTALISFSLLTPIALCLLLVVLVLVVKALEAVFVPLRIPMWLSTPVVAHWGWSCSGILRRCGIRLKSRAHRAFSLKCDSSSCHRTGSPSPVTSPAAATAGLRSAVRPRR